MKVDLDWQTAVQSWVLGTMTSFAAASATAGAVFAVLGLTIELPSSLYTPADWLVLPIFVIGGVLMGMAAGLVAGLFLVAVLLPAAAIGMAIMAFAEHRSTAFRHWAWWSVAGLVVAAASAPAGMAFYNLADSEMKNVVSWDFIAILFVAGLVGALAGRHCWHACTDAGMVLDEPTIEVTSGTS